MEEYCDKLEEYYGSLVLLDDDTLEEKFNDGLNEDIEVEMRIIYLSG